MFCVGLKNKKYCILNKQYTKEEYFKEKKKIIDKLKKENKWGNHLTTNFLNFPYNDTLAYDYFKVNKIIYSDLQEKIINEDSNGIVRLFSNDIISDGELDLGTGKKIKIKWKISNTEVNVPEGMEKIKATKLPNIQDATNNLLEKAIICEETKRPYRIIKQELNFLKKYNLPLPTIHHEERINKLVSRRLTGEFILGKCNKCSKEELTVKNSNYNYKMYCQSCYKEFMYK